MWKVKRTEDEGGIVLSISGRLRGEHLNDLQRAFASQAANQALILDLEDLRLVDHDVVGFLAECEARGASFRNCPAYIQEWMGARHASSESIPG